MATREIKVVKKGKRPATVTATPARGSRKGPAVESFRICDDVRQDASRKTTRGTARTTGRRS